MLLFVGRTDTLSVTTQDISKQSGHFHFDHSHRWTTSKWKMVKRGMATPNVNIPWNVGAEQDFCNQKTFTRLAGYLSDVTEKNIEGGHRTGVGNLLLSSTALTYLQDFFQVVKSKYEATGTEKTKLL